jgi:hypothetical protein
MTSTCLRWRCRRTHLRRECCAVGASWMWTLLLEYHKIARRLFRIRRRRRIEHEGDPVDARLTRGNVLPRGLGRKSPLGRTRLHFAKDLRKPATSRATTSSSNIVGPRNATTAFAPATSTIPIAFSVGTIPSGSASSRVSIGRCECRAGARGGGRGELRPFALGHPMPGPGEGPLTHRTAATLRPQLYPR